MRLIVTCMKNEGPFILEWFAYHLSLGFEKFLVYTNDCDDRTDDIVLRLQQLKYCQHVVNPKIGTQRPQAVAMRDMMKRPIVRNAEWVYFTDCDEFLNIHAGDGSLQALLDYDTEAEVISPMWRLFGDGNVAKFVDEPVVEQFLLAAPANYPVSVNAWGFKSLFKPTENVERIGPHRPFFHDVSKVKGKWRASNGALMEENFFDRGWRYLRGQGGYDLVQLNHYAIRSVESFLVKCHRGHVLHTHKDVDLEYHKMMGHNDQRDLTILRRHDSFREILNELKSDPQLLELHHDAVDRHTKRAKEQKTENAALFEALTSGRVAT